MYIGELGGFRGRMNNSEPNNANSYFFPVEELAI